MKKKAPAAEPVKAAPIVDDAAGKATAAEPVKAAPIVDVAAGKATPAAEPDKAAPIVDGAAGKATVNMRFDVAVLERIDAAAKHQGISRTAWLHVAASMALDK
jgi:hypothetical protein